MNGNPISLNDPTGLDVTVVVWNDGVTHAGIAINSAETVGLYPQVVQYSRIFTCRNMAGALLTDSNFQANSMRSAKSVVIKTTSAQDERMQQYINLIKDGGQPTPDWNPCSFQCASFVLSVLQVGGVPVPSSLGSAPLPTTLFNALQSGKR